MYFQDVRLKVVILELLATCVDTQPGLTEMFLNVQPSDKKGDSKVATLQPHKTGNDTLQRLAYLDA